MSVDKAKSQRQLPLALPHRAAMSRADFIVGPGNRAAVALIDRWPDWPAQPVLLTGPPGSGKSHLVEIWRLASGAGIVAAADLDERCADSLLAVGPVAIEDLHRGQLDEPALFHMFNLARERGRALLVTSDVAPAALPVRLADLVSRLRAMHWVALAEPDEALLRRLLVKLFADRQLAVDPAVIDYIVVRMERSLEAANTIVARLDANALAGRRAVTRPLASQTLAGLYGAASAAGFEEI